MKNKKNIPKLIFYTFLCFILVTVSLTVNVKANDDPDDGVYRRRYYNVLSNDNNDNINEIVVHEGETLLLKFARLDFDDSIIEDSIFSYDTSYYDWVITTDFTVDINNIVYSNDYINTWLAEVESSNYVYLKGIKETSDTYYLTLYRSYDKRTYENDVESFTRVNEVYLSVPIKVIPAEEGVTYIDYGVQKPKNYYDTPEEMFDAMKEVFINHKSGEYTYYVPAGALDDYWDPFYVPYNQYVFGVYDYIFDFNIYQPADGSYGGDYIDQNNYHFKSSTAGSHVGYYNGNKCDYVTIDTTYTIYCTTLEQEAEFEAKLASLFAPGGELEYLKTASDYDKVIGCMNYINAHVNYIGTTEAVYHTAYSALCNNWATCQGYALLYYRMLRELGISNRIVMGTDAAAHTYNLVLLNGKYYYCDVGGNVVLRGENNFSRTDFQDQYFEEEFRTNILNKISSTDYDPNAEPSLTSIGIYTASLDRNGLVAGYDINITNISDVQYRWEAYNKSTQETILIQDWTDNNQWLNWTPYIFGEYEVTAYARNKANTDMVVSAKTDAFEYNPYIKGKCQMPWWGEGGGYLIGVESYENPNQSYQYEMLILDCTLLAEGKPAWVYTTNKFTVEDGAAGWCVWQPQYGYYWTLFRVYDADGNMIDQACYPFVNAY